MWHWNHTQDNFYTLFGSLVSTRLGTRSTPWVQSVRCSSAISDKATPASTLILYRRSTTTATVKGSV